ncbi:UNVERIFIED_CONTAM: hypothetical protein GTU68_008984 [Idotea baltica]|nr:hypothetical protein [Idotea baltica]
MILATLIIGLWAIKWATKLVRKSMQTAKVDESLRKFIASLVNISLKVMLLISVISMLGVATTSFVALLGAAGLAVGMALQGSLGNFAGGVLIILFRPYIVGDLIEAEGFVGKVKEIQIFNTIITTLDNKTAIIPNGTMSSANIINYNSEPIKRVDLTYGISYDDDLVHAKKILKDIASANEKILKDQGQEIYVSELADSSVNLLIRVWAKTEDYWAVYFSMQEAVKLGFDKEGISFPYPQRDVHNIK